LKNKIIDSTALKNIYDFFQDEKMNRIISKSFWRGWSPVDL